VSDGFANAAEKLALQSWATTRQAGSGRLGLCGSRPAETQRMARRLREEDEPEPSGETTLGAGALPLVTRHGASPG